MNFVLYTAVHQALAQLTISPDFSISFGTKKDPEKFATYG